VFARHDRNLMCGAEGSCDIAHTRAFSVPIESERGSCFDAVSSREPVSTLHRHPDAGHHHQQFEITRRQFEGLLLPSSIKNRLNFSPASDRRSRMPLSSSSSGMAVSSATAGFPDERRASRSRSAKNTASAR
jgi:hypothetical protein